jgi:hypothetical protein
MVCVNRPLKRHGSGMVCVNRSLLSSVACLDVPYFSTLFHKQHDIQKQVIEHKLFVLMFSTTFIWSIYHSKMNWARYDHECTVYIGLHLKYPLIFSDFHETRIFSTDFRKILNWEPSYFMWTDGRTTVTKLIVAFRNTANASIKGANKDVRV